MRLSLACTGLVVGGFTAGAWGGSLPVQPLTGATLPRTFAAFPVIIALQRCGKAGVA